MEGQLLIAVTVCVSVAVRPKWLLSVFCFLTRAT